MSIIIFNRHTPSEQAQFDQFELIENSIHHGGGWMIVHKESRQGFRAGKSELEAKKAISFLNAARFPYVEERWDGLYGCTCASAKSKDRVPHLLIQYESSTLPNFETDGEKLINNFLDSFSQAFCDRSKAFGALYTLIQSLNVPAKTEKSSEEERINKWYAVLYAASSYDRGGVDNEEVYKQAQYMGKKYKLPELL